MQPQISIIMPCYNTASWIAQTIESVLLQDGPQWELIIVDDGSTDDTLSILKNYVALAGQERIRVMRNTGKKGPAGARNTGMRSAQGNALFFLDSDDLLWPGALKALYAPLMSGTYQVNRGLSSIFCHQRWLSIKEPFKPDGDEAQTISYPTAGFWQHMYKRDFLEKHQIIFPEDLIIGEDTVFLCHVYSKLDKLAVINKHLNIYRINHKRSVPSAVKAGAFMKHALLSRAFFEQHSRPEWVTPYLEKAFFAEWLDHLHAALAAGHEAALSYMQNYILLTDGIETQLETVLRNALGQSYEEFTRLQKQKDAQSMLNLLNSRDLLKAGNTYMGITLNPDAHGFKRYTAARRLKNVLAAAATRSMLFYLWTLQRRAAKSAAHFKLDRTQTQEKTGHAEQ